MLKQAEKKWWILAVTTAASSLLLMDSTIMPVALPVIEKNLGFSDIGGMWVINSYLLCFTMLLLVGGRLAEIFSFRTIYLWGLIILTIGSCLGGLSHQASMLILARSIQGVGGALLYPSILSMIIRTFPLQQRARALGIDTGIASLFMMLGPVVGGFFTQYLSWRYIFWLNIPFVIIGAIMALWLLKKEKRVNEPFPVVTPFLMGAGIFMLIYGLMEIGRSGLSSVQVMIFLCLGPVFLFVFVWRSLRAIHPLADFRLFKCRLFMASNLIRFVIYLTITATVMWVVFFEKALSYSPFEIGLLIVSSALPVIVVAPIGGWLADHYGYRIPLIVGHVLVLFCMIWVSFFAYSEKILTFLPGLLCFGAGIPLVMTPTIALGLSSVPPEQLGSAAALTAALRQLASTLGVAIMTAVYYSVLKSTQPHAAAFRAVSLVALGFVILGLIATIGLIGSPVGLHRKYNR